MTARLTSSPSSFPRKRESISRPFGKPPAHQMDPRLRGDDEVIKFDGGIIFKGPSHA